MKSKENISLTLQQALDILFHKMKRNGTRQELLERVGEEMYDKLCVLEFIGEGATIDPKTKKRIRVWKATNKPNLFDKISRTQSEQEIQFLNKQLEFSL
jgi:hypothetical protein